MKLKTFEQLASLNGLGEVEKACYLAFFHLKTSQQAEFAVAHVAKWLEELHYSKPNLSRLRTNLRSSRDTVAGSGKDNFRLQRDFIARLEALFPSMADDAEEIVDMGSILPKALYVRTRGYVESLAAQINASYENKIFDGCAILMRRLMEILLIESYAHLGISNEIKGQDGNYMMLERIVDSAKNNKTLQLSRNSKETIEDIRKLGNFSAHKIHYICKSQDIKSVQLEFRALFEELLYKSGIRV